MSKFKIIGKSVNFEDEQQVVGYDYEIENVSSNEGLFACPDFERLEYMGTFHVFARGGENDDMVTEGYQGITLISTELITEEEN
jgi:hypothetical protein